MAFSYSACVVEVEVVHERTVEALADMFVEAGDDHDWCTEMTTVVEDLNDSTSIYCPAFRDRDRDIEYRVEGTATVTITVEVPVSTYVTACDPDSACDAVDWDYVEVVDYLDESTVRDAIRRGSWEVYDVETGDAIEE